MKPIEQGLADARRQQKRHRDNPTASRYWKGYGDALNDILDTENTADQLDHYLRSHIGAELPDLDGLAPNSRQYGLRLGRLGALENILDHLTNHRNKRKHGE